MVVTRPFNGYPPQFYFRTNDLAGTARLDEGTNVIAAQKTPFDIELIAPTVEKGVRFKITRGEETLGSGEFTNIFYDA